MKTAKIICLTSVLSIAFAASAFAASLTDSASTVGTPAATVKPSKNVTIEYTPGADMTGTTGAVSYGMTAIHSSGTKTYGSSSADTKIYSKDGITGNTVAAPTVSAGVPTAPSWSGWTAM